MINPYREYLLPKMRELKAIRIGNIFFDANFAESIIQRYCKHIFVLNDSDDYPYSFRGSGTALKFGDEHFVFCCAHQFSDLAPDLIAISPNVAPKNLITSSNLRIPKAEDQNTSDDSTDIRGFEFIVDNYDIGNLTSDFFPVDKTSIWPAGSMHQDRFYVCGYPFDQQDINYDIPHITARVTVVGGEYDGQSYSPWVHRLRMQRTNIFNSDGMSGGPVFYAGGTVGGYFIGFAGIVIRGSENSDILHFVEADYIQYFARDVPDKSLANQII